MGGEDGCDGSVGIYTVFCVTDSDDVKQRNNNYDTTPSRLSLNRKQRSLLDYVIRVHEILTGIWNPLISGQNVNSFGQGKCAFDCGNQSSQQAHAC